MEGTPHRYHEDHNAQKGMNSVLHFNLVHKFIPMPQAIPDAKASLEKAWENKRKLTKVRNKNEVIAEARNKGNTVHFVSLMDLCHLKKSERFQPERRKRSKLPLLRAVTTKGMRAKTVHRSSAHTLV